MILSFLEHLNNKLPFKISAKITFSKKGVLKSAILVHTAKSSSLICLYLKAEQNVAEIFEKSQFLKI
jgi:hypothetical protein